MTASAILNPLDLKNLPVTVMGLGRFGGGVATVQYLVQHGARVTITDQATQEALQNSLQQIDHLPLQNVFCGHHPDEAFTDCELVVVNPAVRPDHPVLNRCETGGIPVVTEIQLLLQHLRKDGGGTSSTGKLTDSAAAKIVAVTGSNGKSTTAALIHHMLSFEFAQANQQRSESDCRRSWLGGNIGKSLLSVADEIGSQDIVVLELSSFQLHHLRSFAFAPDVAVLTGFSPNHLDWHPDVQHYQAAKQNLFRKQTRHQSAVIPADHQVEGQRGFALSDDDLHSPTWRVRGRLLQFGTVDDGQDGAFWEEETLVVRNAGIEERGVEDAVRIPLPGSLAGTHNLQNLTAAACAAMRCGADPILFSKSVPSFRGLPFRTAASGQKEWIRWINDSASTTPESTIAAVKTFRQQLNRSNGRASGRLVMIVGGKDKGSDPSQMAQALRQQADGVVLIGDVAESLARLIWQDADGPPVSVSIARDFSDAFRTAVELVAPAGIVVLSPGYSSFGWFQDYVDRGQQFDLLVQQWIQK